jgi:phytoene dehydrogenase-like protein
MTLDQLFFMRPLPKHADFRTPIANLYLCGAGCHPGGGIMGAAGYISAKIVEKEMRLGKLFRRRRKTSASPPVGSPILQA